jgi:3-oxoacyl-(acyl-carrier-protein) synthase
VSGHSCTSAAYVPPFDVTGSLHSPKNHKFMTHAVVCAMRAAQEAVEQSGIDLQKLDPTRVAIYTGSGQTGIEYENYFQALAAAWNGNPEMDFKDLGGMPSHLIAMNPSWRVAAFAGSRSTTTWGWWVACTWASTIQAPSHTRGRSHFWAGPRFGCERSRDSGRPSPRS